MTKEQLSEERLREIIDFAERTGAEDVWVPAHALTELLSLRNSASQPLGWRVKGLEWKRVGWVEALAAPEGLGVWYAINALDPKERTPPFTLKIFVGTHTKTSTSQMWIDGGTFATIEEAKAAAEADFGQRALSTLSNAPQQEAEPAGIMVPDGEGGLEPIWYEGTDVSEGDELYLAPPPVDPAPSQDGVVTKKGIYIASKTVHADRWRKLRLVGYPINSTWIDEAGVGDSKDLADLWRRCVAEASSAEVLVLYRQPSETLKGGWVELGAALACGVPVFAVGIEEYTIANDKRIRHFESMADAMAVLKPMINGTSFSALEAALNKGGE
jgi:hypothetical protein